MVIDRFFGRFRGEPPSPSQPPPPNGEFIERLEKGEYLGVMERYGVKWSQETAVRDVLQNFFDSQGYTLDDVNFDLRENIETNDFTLRITGGADYDFRQLVHIGATTKAADAKAAGGFGEGTKISSLVLLRDFGIKSTVYGSRNWELSYYLDNVPEQSYEEPARGLFAKLVEKKKPISGNFIEITSDNRDTLQTFVNARDLFFHSENEDFQSATYENDKGGFKLIPGEKGHFYHAGQRRHFDDPDKWETVAHLHLWTREKCLPPDRDRGTISRREMEDRVVPFIVAAVKPKELPSIVNNLEPIWPNKAGFRSDVGKELLFAICKRAKNEGTSIQFDPKYLATTGFVPSYIEDNLEDAGYVLCPGELGDVGMKSATEKFIELQQHYRVEVTKEEQQRIEILQEVARELGEEVKEIWVFSEEDEKSIFRGRYAEDFVWRSRESLGGGFPEAVAGYVHELKHAIGSDQSAEFSYALTKTMGVIIKEMFEKPEIFRALRDRWDAIEIEEDEKKKKEE